MVEDVTNRTELNKALLRVESNYPDSTVRARLEGHMVVLEGSIGERTDALGILEILGQAVGAGIQIDASRLSIEGAVLASSDTLSAPMLATPSLSDSDS